MNKKCLVLGANGFVGSYLVDALIEEGYEVRAFDRYSRPAQFNENANIEIFKGDFFDDRAIHEALRDVDYVFHAFSATTPSTSDADPYRDISLNVQRNIQLFEKSSEANISKFIFISSGGTVYGRVAERKSADENDAPQPVSPYGIGKLTSEHYLSYFETKYGLKHISYRLSNPYGPRQIEKNNQGVMPVFISKIKNDEELMVVGDGASSRDYIYITDAASIIAKTFNKETQYNVFNLGSGVQTSLNEIIDLLAKGLHKDPKISYKESPKTFVSKSQISIERLKNEFNVYPTIDLADGIERLTSSNN